MRKSLVLKYHSKIIYTQLFSLNRGKRISAGKLLEGWEKKLPVFKQGEKITTRKVLDYFTKDAKQAHDILEELKRNGIDIDEMTQKLEEEINKFKTAYGSLWKRIEDQKHNKN